MIFLVEIPPDVMLFPISLLFFVPKNRSSPLAGFLQNPHVRKAVYRAKLIAAEDGMNLPVDVKFISKPAHCLNILRFCRISLNFFAQIANLHHNCPFIAIMVISPHLLKQLLKSKYLIGVFHKKKQQLQFFGKARSIMRQLLSFLQSPSPPTPPDRATAQALAPAKSPVCGFLPPAC